MQETKIFIHHGHLLKQFIFDKSIKNMIVKKLDEVLRRNLKITDEFEIFELREFSLRKTENTLRTIPMKEFSSLLGQNNLHFKVILKKKTNGRNSKQKFSSKKRSDFEKSKERILSMDSQIMNNEASSYSSHELEIPPNLRLISKEFELIDYWSEAMGIIQGSKKGIKCIFILDNRKELIDESDVEMLEKYKSDIFCYVDDSSYLKNFFYCDNPKLVVYKNSKKTAEIPVNRHIGQFLLDLFEKEEKTISLDVKRNLITEYDKESQSSNENKTIIMKKFVEELDFGDINPENFLRVLFTLYFIIDGNEFLSKNIEEITESKIKENFTQLEKITINEQKIKKVENILEDLDDFKKTKKKIIENIREDNRNLIKKFIKGTITMKEYIEGQNKDKKSKEIKSGNEDISENEISIDVNNLVESPPIFQISPKSRERRRMTANFSFFSKEQFYELARKRFTEDYDYISKGVLKMMKDNEEYKEEFEKRIENFHNIGEIKKKVQEFINKLLSANFLEEHIKGFYEASYLFYQFGEDGNFANLMKVLKQQVEGDKKRLSSTDLISELKNDPNLLSVAPTEFNPYLHKIVEEEGVNYVKNYSELRKKQLKKYNKSISSMRLSVSSKVDSAPKRRNSNVTHTLKRSFHKEMNDKKIKRAGFNNLQVSVGKLSNQKSQSRISSSQGNFYSEEESSESSKKRQREEHLRNFYQNQSMAYEEDRSTLDEILVEINNSKNYKNFLKHQQKNLYDLIDNDIREISDCINIYKRTKSLNQIYDDLEALTNKKFSDISKFMSKKENDKASSYNDFKSLMKHLRDKMREINQKQYELFLEKYLKEELYLLGAHELFVLTGDIDEFIDTLFHIEKVNYDQHKTVKKNDNQIIKEFKHVIQRQKNILEGYKIYLSDDTYKITKQMINEGDSSLLNSYQLFYDNKIKLNEFLSKISKTSFEKLKERKKLKKYSSLKKRKLRKQRKKLEGFLKNEELKGRVTRKFRIELLEIIKEHQTCFKAIRRCFKLNKDKEDFLENLKIFYRINLISKEFLCNIFPRRETEEEYSNLQSKL